MMDPVEILARDVPWPTIDDSRVRFYLENQRMIETWAAIRDEASRELWDCLLGLVDVLAEDAELLGEKDISVAVRDADSGYPRIEVVRRAWEPPDGLAPVCFFIERQGNLINRTGKPELYAGLRMRDATLLSDAQRGKLWDAAAQLRASMGKPWTGSRSKYVLWRWIRPHADALDETVLCREARTALWQAWAAAADIVHSAIAATSDSPNKVTM
jgi:hypothetical protein